jgi:TonB family protein
LSNARQLASVNPLPQGRRLYPRRPVNSLGCIYLSGESGGIVLNVSEGGLAVYSAVIPDLRAMANLRFQLPQYSDWIKARGQVVWTSEKKNEAGIQFVDLPDYARKRIRQWISSRNYPDDFPVSSPMEGPAPPAKMLPTPSDRSSAAVRELESTPQNSSDRLERELHALFERRQSSSGRTTPSHKKTRRRWVAFVCALASLSLVIGLVAGRGKLNAVLGYPVNVTGNAAASVPSVSEDGSLGTNEAPSRAPRPAKASRANLAQSARVTVASQVYVPVSSGQPHTGKVQNLQIGRVNHRVDPEYPGQALRQGIEGTVQLRASISAPGEVRSISVMSGPPLLASYAVNAVRSWRYTPTLLDGKPIETEANITIVFWLPADSETNRPEN